MTYYYKVVLNDTATAGEYSLCIDNMCTTFYKLNTVSVTATTTTAFRLPHTRYINGSGVYIETTAPIDSIFVKHEASGVIIKLPVNAVTYGSVNMLPTVRKAPLPGTVPANSSNAQIISAAGYTYEQLATTTGIPSTFYDVFAADELLSVIEMARNNS